MTQTAPSGPPPKAPPTALSAGTGAPRRARIDVRTLRTDAWWVQPAITAGVLLAFVVYATWRAFQAAYYYASPYLSPFYSPCVSANCTPGADDFGRLVGEWYSFSPALLILIFPLGFRMTCYYYRKAYYRSFWMSPPACAVAEPHRKYTGEVRAPLILQNAHRWFFYAGLAFNLILTWDAVLGFRNSDGEWGHMGLGTVFLVGNATLLWLYSLSCHSCRNTFGGRLKHFSAHPIRYRTWTFISKLNTRHPLFAWLSLFGVALTDFYIYLLASGTVTDPRFF